MDTAATKTGLREEMKTLRAEVAARDPDAHETLAAKFPMRLLERYGPTVAGYVAMGSEIDPAALMRRLELSGAQLCLPRVEDDGETLTYRLWSSGEPLEQRAFGLREPQADAPLARPSLVLTPVLAFDGTGTRLGYGKGHYDRALAILRADGPVFACALAYHAQMVDALPAEPHDQPLDWAMTEQGSVPLFMMRGFAGGQER